MVYVFRGYRNVNSPANIYLLAIETLEGVKYAQS